MHPSFNTNQAKAAEPATATKTLAPFDAACLACAQGAKPFAPGAERHVTTHEIKRWVPFPVAPILRGLACVLTTFPPASAIAI